MQSHKLVVLHHGEEEFMKRFVTLQIVVLPVLHPVSGGVERSHPTLAASHISLKSPRGHRGHLSHLPVRPFQIRSPRDKHATEHVLCVIPETVHTVVLVLACEVFAEFPTPAVLDERFQDVGDVVPIHPRLCKVIPLQLLLGVVDVGRIRPVFNQLRQAVAAPDLFHFPLVQHSRVLPLDVVTNLLRGAVDTPLIHDER